MRQTLIPLPWLAILSATLALVQAADHTVVLNRSFKPPIEIDPEPLVRTILTLTKTRQKVDPTAIHGKQHVETSSDKIADAMKPEKDIDASIKVVDALDAALMTKDASATEYARGPAANNQPERNVLQLSTEPQEGDRHVHYGKQETTASIVNAAASSHGRESGEALAAIPTDDDKQTDMPQYATTSNQAAPQNTRLVLTLSPTPQKIELIQALHEQAIDIDGSVNSASPNASSKTLQAASQRQTRQSPSLNTISLTAEPKLVVNSNYVLRLSRHPQNIQMAAADIANEATTATTRSILRFATYVTATPTQAAKARESPVVLDNANVTNATFSEVPRPLVNAQEFSSRVLGFSDDESPRNVDQPVIVGAALGSTARSDRIVLKRSDPEPGDERAENFRLLIRRADAQRAMLFRTAPSDSAPSETPVTNQSTFSPVELMDSRPGSASLQVASSSPQVVVTEKIGDQDFISMPISILDQRAGYVTFELKQQWTDALNWMAIEYLTDFGWTCPTFQQVPFDKSQIFTAKCSPDGIAEIGVFCRHFTYESSARVPGYCHAPKGNMIATYFSLPCSSA
ncbi:hypothetical protein MPSEU_000022100 [Mayamaea pseudoterrestris]|nr:hypothetical protein MPSEU_000022100 [Mayamaea pseudoterrestris]